MVSIFGRSGLVLGAVLLAGGMWVAPAHADPTYSATISLTNGDFAWMAGGGLTAKRLTGSNYSEVVTGNFSYTNTIPSFSTPYNFVFTGSLTLDNNPVGSFTTPVLSGSVNSLASQFATGLGSYGTYIAAVEASLLGNSLTGTGSVTQTILNDLIPGDPTATGTSAVTVDYNYTPGGGGFALGVSFGSGNAWGRYIDGQLGGLTGTTSTNDIFTASGTLSTVPEPGSMLVLATGLLGLGMVVAPRRRA